MTIGTIVRHKLSGERLIVLANLSYPDNRAYFGGYATRCRDKDGYIADYSPAELEAEVESK